MRALVTGGAGFIGSHIAEALANRGVDVVILDDLSEGNIANLQWNKGADSLEIVPGSVADMNMIASVLRGVDWVFHHAAITSVPKSVTDPVGSNTINLEATLRLLVAARDAKVKRFVFASSSAVYGDSEVSPKREDSPTIPVSPYGLQKLAAERYAQLFHRLYGLETVCLRYFNVFGPRQSFNSPYSGVIARFCTAILERQQPTVFGDGQQTRDFVYVANVVQANLLAVEAPASKVAGKAFNVGSGQSISLLQLIEELNRQTGQSITPRFEPPRAGDIRHSAADISAIRHALSYEPRVTWQEGLKATLDFYRSR